MIFDWLVNNSFTGGTHPPDKKQLTEDKPIKPGPTGKEITVLLSQHIGAIGDPLVKKKDEVEKGQKIGHSDAYVSAPVHSPVKGKVKDISLKPHPILGRSIGITIETAEDNEPENILPDKKFKNYDTSTLNSDKICNAALEAGIVGMGGAGFPTRVKIESNPRLHKEILIINGCECEPYITCDYRLMIEYSNKVLTGTKMAQKSAGSSKVFIGIEDNKPKAIEIMENTIQNTDGCENYEVVPLKTKYPQGGERQLIKAILGKNVPTGAIPPMMGVCVLNVSTAAAIAEAVVFKKPLTHRVVTVTGEAVANPGNYYVPMGTTANELIEFCGGITQKSAKVVLGGPMMGIAIADLDTPITKTSGALTVLTSKQIGRAKFQGRKTQCIRCGRCLNVCPENLNPTQIAHAVKNNDLDMAKSYYIDACIECGSCSYVCPANIELTGLIKTGKIQLARKRKRMPK